jgi:ABC-type amino acid transport substrate-binding protein
LVWSDESGWTSNDETSVIIWPGNSSISTSGYPSISGVILRIAVMEVIPFTIVTQVTDSSSKTTTKLTGYMPDLIELLRTRMGFITNITLVKNQTYDGLIGGVANVDYDMAVADMTITAARSKLTFQTQYLIIHYVLQQLPGLIFLGFIKKSLYILR